MTTTRLSQWLAEQPWETEVEEEEAIKLMISGVQLTLVYPFDNVEVAFEGTLDPRLINGTANDLSPSRLEFKKESGRLTTDSLPAGENELVFSGETLKSEEQGLRTPKLSGKEMTLLQSTF